MSSILSEIQSRRLRYSGTQCYNDRNQPIPCPLSRVELIAVAVVVGLFVVICLTLFVLSKCSCSRRNSMSKIDPEFQFQLARPPPPYRQFESSTERLVKPEQIHAAVHPYHRY